jgi:hypothetical protein
MKDTPSYSENPQPIRLSIVFFLPAVGTVNVLYDTIFPCTYNLELICPFQIIPSSYPQRINPSTMKLPFKNIALIASESSTHSFCFLRYPKSSKQGSTDAFTGSMLLKYKFHLLINRLIALSSILWYSFTSLKSIIRLAFLNTISFHFKSSGVAVTMSLIHHH